jgi:hypothetical protein
MTILLLLFLARALRSHPGTVWLRTRWLGASLVLVGGLGLTGCAALRAKLPGIDVYERLSVFPHALPADSLAVLPEGVLPLDEALEGCSGIQPHHQFVRFACQDDHLVYVARYRVEVEPKVCAAIAREVYPGATLRPGPDLPLPSPSIVFEVIGEDEEEPEPDAGVVVVCVPHRRSGLSFITMMGVPLDASVRDQVLPALAFRGVPDARVTSRQPGSLDLLGRPLAVHSSCRLNSPQNLSCYLGGQMDWMTYGSIWKARIALIKRMAAYRTARGRIVREEDVECVFEGVSTTCQRVILAAKPSLFMRLLGEIQEPGASWTLVIYHVAETVRGRPAVAVCSFYEDQAGSNGLAALCAESFEIPGDSGEER